MNGLGDPLPLGDEVSEGRLSEARDLPSFNTEGFQCNTILHAKNSPCPSPKINYNPNRAQGNERKNHISYIDNLLFMSSTSYT